MVPLTDDILAILRTLPRFKDGDYLFSTAGGGSPVLRGFVVEPLRDQGKRRNGRHGPRGTDLQLRDSTIAFAINHIVDEWKFSAGRNKASKDHACAVSIAQEGLRAGANIHLEEDAINKIWGRYKKFLNPTSSEKKAANK